MKKRSRATGIIAFLLCIPLIFIIYFAFIYASQTIALDGVYQVELTMPDSTRYVFDSVEDVDFFCDLLIDAKEIRTPLREVSGETPMKLVYVGGDKQRYDFYPTLNTDGCMVYSDKGKWYLMSESAATAFLCRSECLYLYEGIMLPTLTLSDGTLSQSIYPAEYEWYYRKIDGNFYRDRTSPIYDGAVPHVYSTSVSDISFALEGGNYTVGFYNADGELSDIHGFSSLEFENDTYIDVIVTAKWNQSSSVDYYGEAEYRFTLLYDVPATVYVSRSSVTAGGFVVLKLDNCSDDEQLTVSTDLCGGEVMIYDGYDGDSKYSVIPVGIDTPAGIYRVELAAPGYKKSLDISVTEFKSSNLVLLSETEEEYNAMLERDILSSVGELLLSAPMPDDYTAYYPIGSAFKMPVSGSATGYFGDEYVIRTSGASYKLPGAMYSSSYGTAVYAAQRGVVVFAKATASTGNTVIIDHGYGIRTYYFNLSAITVSEGALVNAGSSIGNTGNSGFTWTYDSLLNLAASGGDMFQFAVSIDGVFVDNTLFTAALAFREP